MIQVIAIGKRHESWVADGIIRYQKRLRKPWEIAWLVLPHSSQANDAARSDESAHILDKITSDDYVVLLDERGKNIDSPELSRLITQPLNQSKHIVCIIGGAYGVDQSIFERADFTWSLSKLVFPHQMVRLLFTEQLYRAQEIAVGHPYHHS